MTTRRTMRLRPRRNTSGAHGSARGDRGGAAWATAGPDEEPDERVDEQPADRGEEQHANAGQHQTKRKAAAGPERAFEPVRERRLVTRRACLPFGGVAGEHADDVVGAARNAAREVARAKVRQDGLLDDVLGDGVGQHALEAVANLDAHLALARRHDEHDAIVLALLPDLPAPAERDAVLLDGLAAQRTQRHDHELVAGLGLERGELRDQLDACAIGEDIGFIDHAPAEHREIDRLRDRGGREGRERERGRDKPRAASAQEFCRVIPGRRAAPDPESITTSVSGYGFRARELRSRPGMTG